MERFTTQNLQCTAGNKRVSTELLDFQVVKDTKRHQKGCKHTLSQFKRSNLKGILFMEGLFGVESNS